MIGAPPTADIGRSIRPTAIVGFAIVALFFGGFGAWAALAPLDSAVIASGVIVVEGSRQTVVQKGWLDYTEITPVYPPAGCDDTYST